MNCGALEAFNSSLLSWFCLVERNRKNVVTTRIYKRCCGCERMKTVLVWYVEEKERQEIERDLDCKNGVC